MVGFSDSQKLLNLWNWNRSPKRSFQQLLSFRGSLLWLVLPSAILWLVKCKLHLTPSLLRENLGLDPIWSRILTFIAMAICLSLITAPEDIKYISYIATFAIVGLSKQSIMFSLDYVGSCFDGYADSWNKL